MVRCTRRGPALNAHAGADLPRVKVVIVSERVFNDDEKDDDDDDN